MQPTAFGKLHKVAANRRIRVAGRAKFRTRQELLRSEWPISHQFATRSASERENCMQQVPKFLNNPGKTCSPKRTCQVVNVRDCSNRVLVIAGSPEFNPGSRNQSQSRRMVPICNVNFKSCRGFRSSSGSPWRYMKM